MGIFQEFFPVKRESISAYVEQQMKKEAASGEVSTAAEISSVLKVSRKPSMIQGLIDDTAADLRQSKQRDNLMTELHKQMKNFDEINFFMAPMPMSDEIPLDRKRVEIAESESVLSMLMEKRTVPEEPPSDRIKRQPKKAFESSTKSRFTATSDGATNKKPINKTISMPDASMKPPKAKKTVSFPNKKSNEVVVHRFVKSSTVHDILQAKSKRESKIPISIIDLKFL